MNKKGFTLVELLAVIVILAIISLITVPILLNVIDVAKKGALEDSAYGIIKAGELYYAQNLNNDQDIDRYNFEVKDNKFVDSSDNSKALSFKGKMPKTGILQINKNGKSAIAICDNKYCACKSINELKVNIQESNCNINSETGEIENIVSAQYPIGSIYISVSDENPETYFGGTWESFGEGRTLIGVGEGTDSNNESKTFNINETGGEYNHLLTIDEMPSHAHSFSHPSWTYDDFVQSTTFLASQDFITKSISDSTSRTGGSKTHNNIQPYITVYMWKRIS